MQIDRICLVNLYDACICMGLSYLMPLQERLIELSATYGYERQLRSKIAFGRIGDVSQKGNWSCFRNEFYEGNYDMNSSYFNWIWKYPYPSTIVDVLRGILVYIAGNPMTLNGSFLSPLPGKGKLEFDFSGSGRPRTDVVVRMLVHNTSFNHRSCFLLLLCLTIAGHE